MARRTRRSTTPTVRHVFLDVDPDLWGTPCFASDNTATATPCPRIWPELGTGGVGPHGATTYHHDPDNPSTTNFPPYYSSGKTDVKTVTITAGNTSPPVTVNTAVDGDFFDWRPSIPYTVTVTDPEDGAIDCGRVTVAFVLVHDEHGTPSRARAAARA